MLDMCDGDRLRNLKMSCVTCSPRPPTFTRRQTDLRLRLYRDLVIYSKFHRYLFGTTWVAALLWLLACAEQQLLLPYRAVPSDDEFSFCGFHIAVYFVRRSATNCFILHPWERNGDGIMPYYPTFLSSERKHRNAQEPNSVTSKFFN